MRFLFQLIEAVKEEDFFKTNEVLSLITQDDDFAGYIRPLLLFMEDNPDVDYGMPGPLVHYMERYYMYGYEELLYESVNRKPTIHTLWMLNRVINSQRLVNKDKYLALLEKVSKDTNQSNIVRNEASQYMQYQKSQGE